MVRAGLMLRLARLERQMDPYTRMLEGKGLAALLRFHAQHPESWDVEEDTSSLAQLLREAQQRREQEGRPRRPRPRPCGRTTG